jgi:hypothetical protein
MGKANDVRIQLLSGSRARLPSPDGLRHTDDKRLWENEFLPALCQSGRMDSAGCLAGAVAEVSGLSGGLHRDWNRRQPDDFDHRLFAGLARRRLCFFLDAFTRENDLEMLVNP